MERLAVVHIYGGDTIHAYQYGQRPFCNLSSTVQNREKYSILTLNLPFLIISSTTFSHTHTSTVVPHLRATLVVKGAMPSFALAGLD